MRDVCACVYMYIKKQHLDLHKPKETILKVSTYNKGSCFSLH